MKPTKKKPSKRYANMSDGNPIIEKLLKLKYRINDAYRNDGVDTKDDKNWVMNLISSVRDNNWIKLAKEDMLYCNEIWRKYD